MDAIITFLAFPVNLIFALVWAAGVLWLWRYCRHSSAVCFLLSRGAVISSISLMLIFCLVIGFTGVRRLAYSIPFALVMLYLMTVLAFVLLRGWRVRGKTGLSSIRWRFVMLHAGLLLALASSFWGRPDTETLHMSISKGVSADEAYRPDGTLKVLPYQVELKDLDVRFYDGGTPMSYEASLLVGGKEALVKVNHPYRISFGEDLYLAGVDPDKGTDSCVVMIVREPGRYSTLAGILMIICGAFLMFFAGPVKKRKSVAYGDME